MKEPVSYYYIADSKEKLKEDFKDFSGFDVRKITGGLQTEHITVGKLTPRTKDGKYIFEIPTSLNWNNEIKLSNKHKLKLLTKEDVWKLMPKEYVE